MNKKIYAGMMAFGAAASFWACGSGEIIKPEDNDKVAVALAVQDSVDVVNLGTLKAQCPECDKATPSSSSRTIIAKQSSSSRTNPKSSSSQLVINSATSSSTPPVIENSSSSQSGPTPIYSSSSSATIPGTGDPGTCAPEKPTVESGEKVNWVFTNGKDLPGNLMMNSDFTWTTSDGDPASATIGGYKGRNHSVTYATTGKHNASVSILVKTTGATYNVPCTPVQVNGAPITGCKCTAAEKNPDVSVGAKWTVTGCTSAGANITTYEWLGATAAEDGKSATQAFTKKNQLAAPVVNVGNDDNTVVAVQCDSVISVDATDPDYVLTFEGSSIPASTKTSVDIPLNTEACIQVSFKWEGGWTPNNISVLCDATAAQNQPGLTMDISYNGTSKSYTGDYNISNSGLALGAVTAGQNTMKDVCVTVTGKAGGSAKCFFGN